jgi:hypothetical protein
MTPDDPRAEVTAMIDDVIAAPTEFRHIAAHLLCDPCADELERRRRAARDGDYATAWCPHLNVFGAWHSGALTLRVVHSRAEADAFAKLLTGLAAQADLAVERASGRAEN